jgi:cell division protein FtsB
MGPLIGFSAVVYFAYHTIEGDRGVLAWLRLKTEIANAEVHLATLTARQQDLQHRVDLLRPNHLDPDLLGERARAMLDVGRPGDIVVFYKHAEAPKE